MISIRMVGLGVALLISVGLCLSPAAAQQPPANDPPPPPVVDECTRLLELGKQLVGQNNPAHATKKETLDAEARNTAGAQARRTLALLVKKYPKCAEAWLWLGITLTETLTYSKKHPKGELKTNDADIAEGLHAFRTAHQLAPNELPCACFYSDALMEFRQDFKAACQLWERFLLGARNDEQRVTANVQAARACLNEAYFGKTQKKLKPAQVKQQFEKACTFLQAATAIWPKAPDVLEMKQLIEQYRPELAGTAPPR